MVYYLILCKSLTYAQRTVEALERVGITGRLLRSPEGISSEGCGYCVKVSERYLSQALTNLNQVGLPPKRVFILSSDSTYREVRLL